MLAGNAQTAGAILLTRGLELQQKGRHDEAIVAYRRVIRVEPGLAPAHFNLGLLLRARGDHAGAVACFEGAARLRPTAADAWLNLGATLEQLERFEEAVSAYDRTVACAVEDPRGYFSRGNALLALGRCREAAGAYRQTLEIAPTHTEAGWNLATALLAGGELLDGWTQYERRWGIKGLDPAARFPWPLWQGEALGGKRILVWREQGLGDELLFATCVPDLVAAGAEVTFAVTPRLVSLFARALPGVTVVEDGALSDETFDFHAPVGGLPRFLRTRLESFPGAKLLVPASTHATRWSRRMEALGAGPRIGICWRSGLVTEQRVRHSSTLDAWGPVFAVPGVHWVNLQYDDCTAELEAAERQFDVRIHRWPNEDLKNDLESVVGLLWSLDAVITAPSAVSSLAGLVGTRTWQIDVGSDWTALGCDRSPWFPNLRVMRRSTTDWALVIEQVARELGAIVETEVVA